MKFSHKTFHYISALDNMGLFPVQSQSKCKSHRSEVFASRIKDHIFIHCGPLFLAPVSKPLPGLGREILKGSIMQTYILKLNSLKLKIKCNISRFPLPSYLWDNSNVLTVLIGKFQVLCFGKNQQSGLEEKSSVPSFTEPFARWVRFLLASGLDSTPGKLPRPSCHGGCLIFYLLSPFWPASAATALNGHQTSRFSSCADRLNRRSGFDIGKRSQCRHTQSHLLKGKIDVARKSPALLKPFFLPPFSVSRLSPWPPIIGCCQ